MAEALFGGMIPVTPAAAMEPFTRVKFNTTLGTVAACGLGEIADGIVQNRVTSAMVTAGERVTMRPLNDPGIHLALLSGTCAVNDLLYPAASGKVSTTASGLPVGRAHTTGADGDEVAFRPFRVNAGAVVGTKTAAYTAAFGETVLCDPTGGAFTVTLPPALAGMPDITIKNNSTSTTAITIDGDAAETIDGAATISIAASRGVRTVRPIAGQWYLVGN